MAVLCWPRSTANWYVDVPTAQMEARAHTSVKHGSGTGKPHDVGRLITAKAKRGARVDGQTDGLCGKDPVFWALYAYIAVEAKKRDKALSVVSDGLKKCPDSTGLKELQGTIANKRKLKMKAFAPTWYQYFPEQMPRSQMQQYAGQQQGGMRYPQPRR